MSSLKLLLCLFILHLSHKVSAFPGFYDINDPSIPKKVQEATQSVYKIISQGGDVDFVLNMKDSQLVESKLSQIIKEDRWFEKMQVDQCFKEHNSICPVFKQVGEGSAFLLHNQVSIYTNLHNFYETLSEQIKSLKSNDRAKIKSVLFNFPLFVKMVNQNKKPLFDLNTDTAYLNLSNPDFRLYDGKKDSMINDLGRLSDIIELNLTHKIESSPLQISQNPIQKDETLYIIGFPSKTTTRKTLFSAPDSDGESMYISKGKPLTVKSWEERIQYPLHPVVEKLFEEFMLFGDFDCEHGNSGGPIVNSKGEVVAIMAGMWLDQTQTTPSRICGGLKVFDKKKLEELWNTLSVLMK